MLLLVRHLLLLAMHWFLVAPCFFCFNCNATAWFSSVQKKTCLYVAQAKKRQQHVFNQKTLCGHFFFFTVATLHRLRLRNVTSRREAKTLLTKKLMFFSRPSVMIFPGARTLLGAPGLTTRNKNATFGAFLFTLVERAGVRSLANASRPTILLRPLQRNHLKHTSNTRFTQIHTSLEHMNHWNFKGSRVAGTQTCMGASHAKHRLLLTRWNARN